MCQLDGRTLPRSAGAQLLDEASESGFCLGDEFAPASGTVQHADDGARLTYRHPAAVENLLHVTMSRPQADRVRFNCRYEVRQPLDRAVPVHFIVRPASAMTRMTTFTWRRSGDDPYRSQPLPGPDSRGERYAFLSQTPFAMVRFDDGFLLGALDYDQTNIIMAAGRDDSGKQLLRVSTHLWPRQQGRVYRWSFELIAGWCDDHNALLQAI